MTVVGISAYKIGQLIWRSVFDFSCWYLRVFTSNVKTYAGTSLNAYESMSTLYNQASSQLRRNMPHCRPTVMGTDILEATAGRDIERVSPQYLSAPRGFREVLTFLYSWCCIRSVETKNMHASCGVIKIKIIVTCSGCSHMSA